MKRNNIKSFLIYVLVLINFQVLSQSKYMTMGNNAYDGKQYTSAIEYYTKALSKFDGEKPERNQVVFKLAECYRMINDPRKAEINYQRLIKNKFADEKPEVYLFYANALRAQGKYAEALPVYEQYLRKAPNDPLALAGKAGCEMNEIKNPDESRWAVRPIKEINSADDDFGAVYTDSKFNSILFTSNRKGTIGKEKDNWTDGYFSDFFTSAKGKSENYMTPVLADDRDLINTKANEGAGCFDDQFKKFYFTRCEKMNKDKEYCRIFEASKAGNSWGRPQLLYADSLGNAGQPSISTNGLWMIIASNRPGGQGGKDLWKLTRSSERKPFANPENLGSIINTPGDELFPTLFADTVLYFASNGRPGFGGLDIYRVIIGKNGVTNIEHLPKPINSYADDFAMNFETNKERGFLTSRRDGGKGGDDIYYFEKLNRKISLKGTVKDEITGLPLQQNSVLLTNTTNDTSKFITDASGKFAVAEGVLEEENNYRLIFSKDNYFSKSTELKVGKLNNDTTYLFEISLLPIPEKPIVLPDIYYDLNKWDLLPQYQDSLLVLVKILNDNPKITIELASHTDSRATDVYNDTLSLKRAQTVVQFLTEKGINSERLTAKGYGEQIPRTLSSSITRDGFTFEKGTKLTEAYILAIKDEKKREAAFQLNRRTEFSVTGKNFK